MQLLTPDDTMNDIYIPVHSYYFVILGGVGDLIYTLMYLLMVQGLYMAKTDKTTARWHQISTAKILRRTNKLQYYNFE